MGLYRPQNIPSNIFYLCLLLTILFNDDYTMHFNLNYDGGNNTLVVIYYFVLLLSIIGCTVCVWMTYLQFLCVFYSSFITDLILSLLWMEHHIQFIHWTFTIIICYLLAKYLSYSFGKWNFLQSQTRLEELEQLQL